MRAKTLPAKPAAVKREPTLSDVAAEIARDSDMTREVIDECIKLKLYAVSVYADSLKGSADFYMEYHREVLWDKGSEVANSVLQTLEERARAAMDAVEALRSASQKIAAAADAERNARAQTGGAHGGEQ